MAVFVLSNFLFHLNFYVMRYRRFKRYRSRRPYGRRRRSSRRWRSSRVRLSRGGIRL